MAELVSCAAILAVRNEALHIRRVLHEFIRQGIDIVVIDNESTDGTLDICREYLGKGLLFMEQLDWTGRFDLSAQLDAKRSIAARLDHDWLIHTDADEWMQSPVKGESLLEGISRVSAIGCNVINFDEFVFLPVADKYRPSSHYEQEILHYYYFAPAKIRLMRAWQRSADLSNKPSAGHLLTGNKLNIAPESFILRHYIALSQQDAIAKYVGRKFTEADLSKGWHRNRYQLTQAQLRFPDPQQLKKLPAWGAVTFDRSDPKSRHYWVWDDH